MGKFMQGIFTTILPGEQISPRMKVTETVNSLSIEEGKYITRPTRLTTPTYIGQLVLRWGIHFSSFWIPYFWCCYFTDNLYNQVKREGHRSDAGCSICICFNYVLSYIYDNTAFATFDFYLMIGFVILTSAIGTKN